MIRNTVKTPLKSGLYRPFQGQKQIYRISSWFFNNLARSKDWRSVREQALVTLIFFKELRMYKFRCEYCKRRFSIFQFMFHNQITRNKELACKGCKKIFHLNSKSILISFFLGIIGYILSFFSFVLFFSLFVSDVGSCFLIASIPAFFVLYYVQSFMVVYYYNKGQYRDPENRENKK